MDIKKEEKIINNCKKDKRHFEQLYNEYVQDVYRYVVSIIWDNEKAKDIVQETFFRALNKIDSFEFRGTTIKTWFISIARNIIYESYAQESFETEDNYMEIDEMEDIESNLKIDEKLKSDILEIIATLPPSTKEILMLKIWERYTFEEIAEITKRSLSSVKMTYYRGLEKFKDKLSEKGYDKNVLKWGFIVSGILILKNIEKFKFGKILAKEIISNLINTKMTALSKPLILKLAAVILCSTAIVGYTYVAFKNVDKKTTNPTNQQNNDQNNDQDNDPNNGQNNDQDNDPSNGQNNDQDNDPSNDHPENNIPTVDMSMEFSINSTYGGKVSQALKVNAKVPEGTNVVYSGDINVDGQGCFSKGDERLCFNVPFEKYTKQFSSYSYIGNNTQSGKIYKVVVKDNNNIGYTNTKPSEEKCLTLKNTYLNPPCGNHWVDFQKDPLTSYVAFCKTNNSESTFCDNIMKTVNATVIDYKKVNLSMEDYPKDKNILMVETLASNDTIVKNDMFTFTNKNVSFGYYILSNNKYSLDMISPPESHYTDYSEKYLVESDPVLGNIYRFKLNNTQWVYSNQQIFETNAACKAKESSVKGNECVLPVVAVKNSANKDELISITCNIKSDESLNTCDKIIRYMRISVAEGYYIVYADVGSNTKPLPYYDMVNYYDFGINERSHQLTEYLCTAQLGYDCNGVLKVKESENVKFPVLKNLKENDKLKIVAKTFNAGGNSNFANLFVQDIIRIERIHDNIIVE